MGQGTKGFDSMANHPELGELLLRMLRAQGVQAESAGEAVAAVAEQLNMNADEEDD